LAQDKIVPKRQRAFGDIQARHIGPALMSGRLPILKCIQQTTRSFTQVQLAAVYGKSNDGGASFIQYLMNIFNLLAVLQLILQNQTKTFGLVLEKHGLEIVFPWEMAFTSRQMEVRTGTWDYLNLTEFSIIVDQRIAILFGLVFLVPCGEVMKGCL
jgi:hypothetical protein